MKGNQVPNKLNDAYQKMETLVKFLHAFGKTQTDLSGGPEQLNWAMEQRAPAVFRSRARPEAVLFVPEQ